MVEIRPANERGNGNHGWLNSYHTFSFADYYDPRHMGVSILRVINDDTVQPGAGFDTHGHKDMEIISYVLDGSLEHKDSMGNGSIIERGDLQRMSAGTGVLHSEFNHSKGEPVHFLQIWLLPNKVGVEPTYEQKHFPLELRRANLVLLVSPDGRDGSLSSNQNGLLYGALLEAGDSVEHMLSTGRTAYVHVAHGSVVMNGITMNTGDGATITNDSRIHIEGKENAEILLFDLP